MCFVIEDQVQAECLVDLPLTIRVRLLEDLQHSAECLDEGPDLFPAHAPLPAAASSHPSRLELRRGPPALDLTGPAGDEGRVGSGLQRGAMTSRLPVAFGDRLAYGVGLQVVLGRYVLEGCAGQKLGYRV
ncbi:hypothetical protein [Embleya sp. NPDC001921]